MKYYLFNLDLIKEKEITDEKNISFKITTTKEIIPKNFKEIILIEKFEKTALFKIFYPFYPIIIEEKKEEKLFKHSFIGEIKELEKNNIINDLKYSLTKINKYYDEPYKHFSKREFYTITENDFNTIKNGKVFFARTMFGKIVNSLSKHHKNDFIKFIIEDDPNLFINKKFDYLNLLRLLKEYINENIVIPSNFLNKSFEIFQKVTEKNYKSINFSNSDNNTTTLGENDISIINSFLTYNEIKNNNFLDQIINVVQEDKENNFNKIFRNKGLPISYE